MFKKLLAMKIVRNPVTTMYFTVWMLVFLGLFLVSH